MLFVYELFFHLQTQSIEKPPDDGKTLYLIISEINFGLIKSIRKKLVYTLKNFKDFRTEF